jgi:alpha-amylase/alpha-mannosidase (GH57 family)
MSFKTGMIFFLLVWLLVPIFASETDIPVVDDSRIDQFKKNLKKILEDIQWAIGIYKDVKGSYQRVDTLLSTVKAEISSLIKGEALEILKGALTGDFKEILLSADYFKQYTKGRFEQLLKRALHIEVYFAETEEEKEELDRNVYMQNTRVKKRYEENSKIKQELMATTEEALEILDQIGKFAESIEKDSEMKIIDDMLNRVNAHGGSNPNVINVDIMWAVYGLSEFKRMIKVFSTYAILEQKRKESIHFDLLRARAFAMQLQEE